MVDIKKICLKCLKQESIYPTNRLCLDCAQKYYAKYYRENKEKYKERMKAMTMEQRARHRLKIKERNQRYKGVMVYDDITQAQVKYSTLTCRKYSIKKYGLSITQFKEKVELQNRLCAICKTPFSRERKHLPYVDHNHTTGKNRGILCFDCNTILGKVKDNKILLSSFINYLDQYT